MEQQPPTRVGRRLSAIVAADVAGYSRLMGLDEVGTARVLREHRVVSDALVAKHGGRIVKTTGDGVLLEFPSVVDAVECAVAVQAVMAERNEGVPADRRMLFRIGINLGDILIEGDDILGDGVNIAARLEGIAEPGGICISSSAYDQVRGKVAVEFTDLGEQRLKNIDRPIRLYAARSASDSRRDQAALHQASLQTGGQVLPLPDKPSIAVLPFTNMSGDPEQEYFADGMAEDIITSLSRLKSLFVIARNSSFTYKGKTVDIKQVGQELGVRYVLEGSVRRAGDRLRITGQLIERTEVTFGLIAGTAALLIFFRHRMKSPQGLRMRLVMRWSGRRLDESRVRDKRISRRGSSAYRLGRVSTAGIAKPASGALNSDERRYD